MESIKYIDIDKSLIPYMFNISLMGDTFTVGINYNTLSDFFTVDLSRNGVSIIQGEKLVYGKPLFMNAMYKEVPYVTIIPFDLSESVDRITFENFNKDVLLYVLESD